MLTTMLGTFKSIILLLLKHNRTFIRKTKFTINVKEVRRNCINDVITIAKPGKLLHARN
jgi:hypothetical protein